MLSSVIVKASSGPRYVVGCRNKVDKAKLTSGTRVALDMTTLTIMRALPREVRPFCGERGRSEQERAGDMQALAGAGMCWGGGGGAEECPRGEGAGRSGRGAAATQASNDRNAGVGWGETGQREQGGAGDGLPSAGTRRCWHVCAIVWRGEYGAVVQGVGQCVVVGEGG